MMNDCAEPTRMNAWCCNAQQQHHYTENAIAHRATIQQPWNLSGAESQKTAAEFVVESVYNSVNYLCYYYNIHSIGNTWAAMSVAWQISGATNICRSLGHKLWSFQWHYFYSGQPKEILCYIFDLNCINFSHFYAKQRIQILFCLVFQISQHQFEQSFF